MSPATFLTILHGRPVRIPGGSVASLSMQVLFIMHSSGSLSRSFHYFLVVERLVQFVNIQLDIVYRRPGRAVVRVLVKALAGVSQLLDVVTRSHSACLWQS